MISIVRVAILRPTPAPASMPKPIKAPPLVATIANAAPTPPTTIPMTERAIPHPDLF